MEEYFKEASENSRLVSSCTIYAALKNLVKLYYQFLKFVLPKFTNFDKLFQSEMLNIHFLTSYLSSTYRGFLSCFLSPMCIRSTSLEQINPESHENLLPLGAISMGDVAQFAAQLPLLSCDVKEEFKSFLQYVQLFYIEAAK